MSKHAINEYHHYRSAEDTYRRQRNRILALAVLLLVGRLVASVL